MEMYFPPNLIHIQSRINTLDNVLISKFEYFYIPGNKQVALIKWTVTWSVRMEQVFQIFRWLYGAHEFFWNELSRNESGFVWKWNLIATGRSRLLKGWVWAHMSKMEVCSIHSQPAFEVLTPASIPYIQAFPFPRIDSHHLSFWSSNPHPRATLSRSFKYLLSNPYMFRVFQWKIIYRSACQVNRRVPNNRPRVNPDVPDFPGGLQTMPLLSRECLEIPSIRALLQHTCPMRTTQTIRAL